MYGTGCTFVLFAIFAVGIALMFANHTFGASLQDLLTNLMVLTVSFLFVAAIWVYFLAPMTHLLHTPSPFAHASHGHTHSGAHMQRGVSAPPSTQNVLLSPLPMLLEQSSTSSSGAAAATATALALAPPSFAQAAPSVDASCILNGSRVLLRTDNVMKQFVSAHALSFGYRYPTASDKEPVPLIFTVVQDAKAASTSAILHTAPPNLVYGATVMITSTEEELHSRCLTVWEGNSYAFWYPPAKDGSADERQLWRIGHATSTPDEVVCTVEHFHFSVWQIKDDARAARYGDVFTLENVHFAKKPGKKGARPFSFLSLYVHGGIYYLTTVQNGYVWVAEMECADALN